MKNLERPDFCSLVVLTIVGIACFSYLACRQASKNTPLSVLLVTGWLIMSVFPWMQVSHHWFATVFSAVVAWAALASLEQPENRLRWPLIAGCAAGAATMAVPHSGALVMLAAVVAFANLRQNRAALVAYVFGCALAPAATLAYLIGQHTLVAAFDDIIRFPATHYSSVNVVPYGFAVSMINRPLKYVFGVAGLLTVLVAAYDWRASLEDRRLRLCVALALAGFFGCYPRPDILHIAYVVPLALPLLAFCTTRLTQSWRPAYRYATAAVVIGLCLPSLYIFQGDARAALFRGEIVRTPRGDVSLIGPVTPHRGVPSLLTRIAATPIGDAYFFYPYDAMLPFLTERQHVSNIDLFAPWYTTPVQYREACKSVIGQASWVVVDRTWTDRAGWSAIFPSMLEGMPQETIRFEQTLDNAFDLVGSDGAFELRRRREDVSDAVCNDIHGQRYECPPAQRELAEALRGGGSSRMDRRIRDMGALRVNLDYFGIVFSFAVLDPKREPVIRHAAPAAASPHIRSSLDSDDERRPDSGIPGPNPFGPLGMTITPATRSPKSRYP